MKNFYRLTIEEIFKSLKTNIDGLKQEEVNFRLERDGFNELKKDKKNSKLLLLLNQFRSPLIYILLIAGLISLLFKEYVDSIVIFTSILINTIIGFFQENKANESLQKIKKMIRQKVDVIRNGQVKNIDSKNLVLGDIVLLKAGERISADARIIEAYDLQINESSLTGESDSICKRNFLISEELSIGDRENMVFAGTLIVRGHAKAVVTAVGHNTELGNIASLVKDTEEKDTPLQVRLSKLSKLIGFFVFLICSLVIFIGILEGRSFWKMFSTGVAVAVASIPEGLIISVTVILVVGMNKILKRKSLVRKLVAAETLGSTSVICSDKTGTLTTGDMKLVNVVTHDMEFDLEDLDKDLDQKKIDILNNLLKIGVICNNANLSSDQKNILGSSTEKSIIQSAIDNGIDVRKFQEDNKRIFEIPFSSDTKFMTTFNKDKDKITLYEKGAPEILLEKSKYFYQDAKVCVIDDEVLEDFRKISNDLTSRGLRVIGVAKKEIKENFENDDFSNLDNDLIFYGFFALKDPLRDEAKETISACSKLGIRPVIITGDHPFTARSIASEIGMEIDGKKIITGQDLDSISDKDLKTKVLDINVYARVNPEHKLRIIKAWQARGEVVAMTGDGVNDAPALKASDIGISLGNGTDIAKETADLILLDNNFKTIVEAVRQGRIIFNNIRKVITYLISDSFSEVILILGSLILNLPLAILPVQILWVNIINDGFPNFALAFEGDDKDSVLEKPVLKEEPIINKEMKFIIFIAGLVRDFFIFGIFYWLLKFSHIDYNIDYIRTLVFAMIGIDSLLYVFSLKSFTQPIWKMNIFNNMYLIVAVLISFFLLLIAIYLPPLQSALSTVPLGIYSWLVIFVVGFFSIIIIEIIKYNFFKKKYKKVYA